MGKTDRLGRTGGEAFAAAGAAVKVDLRHGNAANARRETDGSGFAEFAAGAANDVLQGQAAVVDDNAQIPGALGEIGSDGVRGASAAAVTAEGAMPLAEVSDRVIARPGLQQAGGTGTQAIAATRADIGESAFCQRPGRTLGGLHRSSAAMQKAATSKIHENPPKELGPWY